MRVFTDSLGRSWALTIHVAAVKRVRAYCEVDLNTLLEDGLEAYSELVGDPIKFVDVLYVLCQQEAEEKKITDEDFGRGLFGEGIDRAKAAFDQELADFFPDQRRREAARRIMTAKAQVESILLRELEQSAPLNAESIVRSSRKPSTDSPESSASIREDLPSASSRGWKAPELAPNGDGPQASSPSSPTSTAIPASDQPPIGRRISPLSSG